MVSVEVHQFGRKKRNSVNEQRSTRMSLVTVYIPRMMLDAIDDLVRDEVFASRAEAIRASVLLMLIELRKLENDAGLIKLLVHRAPERNKAP